ncbi:Sister chromatid cohesion protein 2 [Cryomyces antarcticus]|nr:Sister chromatid cohesion protein 2 [Cryomyces antarcticus]
MTCLIPVVEARNTCPESETFGLFTKQKKHLASLLRTFGEVLQLIRELFLQVDVTEDAITAVEFLLIWLILVLNALNEKDSALSIQEFEVIRWLAMDVIARIFSRYPDQRTFILSNIIVSLEKLPATRKSAREFKTDDGKPIQLVSALLMRLAQASSARSNQDRRKKRNDSVTWPDYATKPNIASELE